ncbi:ABC transporter substrate-binding protein [Aureimonas endophytica]|uniref:ABC transporter substrate-binding protein n=1 Tax=Aureimonas endophytica TaxID=2027858 RepID=A0A917E334_9HYPH|nr:ABC transporter substrate-binding protein [Aureimonas endophytica]GGD95755.1 ABC transporter substrate-binding protein [Aureimonas endophytica]
MPDQTPKTPATPSRRQILKGAAALGLAASGANLFNINHAWSQDVTYDGGTFDAGGATITIAEWGGFWQETQRKHLLDQFEKDFNCKVQYDSSFPWFPKFVANGPKNPPFAVTNWNLPEMFKTAAAGDYFLPQEEMIANMPNAKGVWPFATANGLGVTWAFSRYCYVYRTDTGLPAPTSFKDFWDARYAAKRGTYVTTNTLQMDFFIGAALNFGKDQYDLDAAYEAMRQAMPMKISDFTGNMQALVERGEVEIAVQNDGEVYLQKAKGVPVDAYIWDNPKSILTQTKTVSRYLEPVQKKLALALVNRTLDPAYQTAIGEVFFYRPSHKDAKLPKGLLDQGVENTANALDGLWMPDWKSYLENEDDIVETVNQIFAS